MNTATLDPQTSPVRQWILAIARAEEGYPSNVAERRGISPTTITRFMSGETSTLQVGTLEKLAADCPVPIPLEVQRILDARSKTAREQGVNILTSFSNDNIPIWGVHPVQRDGEFKLNPIPVSEIKRAGFANKSLKLAAFYAPDDTMMPRWSAGEPVLFDLAKPAAIGDCAMIRLSPDIDQNETETYLFRQLGRRSNGKLEVYALADPDKPIFIPLDRVLEVRHVLTWSDILG